MLTESINRIISIAAVHDVLSKEELDQVNVKRVCETIMTLTSQSLFRPGHRIVTKPPLDNPLRLFNLRPAFSTRSLRVLTRWGAGI